MRPGPVLCAGRLYCDLVFQGLPRLPSPGTEVFAGGLSLHAGGGAFITAAHLAALDRPAGLAAWRPAPPFDAPVLDDLAAARLDLSLMRAGAAAPQVTVAMAHGTDRAFLTQRAGPAVPPLVAADLTERRVAHLHIGEMTTLIEAPWLLDVARAAGATVSLDCGWDEALPRAAARAAAARVDLFLPNAAEADWLGLEGPLAPLTVVKCGAAGARAWTADGWRGVPAAPAVCVDATGAGDAFNAGFLAAWLQGRDIERCMEAGNRAGARAVGHAGGFVPAPQPAIP